MSLDVITQSVGTGWRTRCRSTCSGGRPRRSRSCRVFRRNLRGPDVDRFQGPTRAKHGLTIVMLSRRVKKRASTAHLAQHPRRRRAVTVDRRATQEDGSGSGALSGPPGADRRAIGGRGSWRQSRAGVVRAFVCRAPRSEARARLTRPTPPPTLQRTGISSPRPPAGAASHPAAVTASSRWPGRSRASRRARDGRRAILGGAKPVSRPLPDSAVSPAGAFPAWPDSSARQAGPARARAGGDGLGET